MGQEHQKGKSLRCVPLLTFCGVLFGVGLAVNVLIYIYPANRLCQSAKFSRAEWSDGSASQAGLANLVNASRDEALALARSELAKLRGELSAVQKATERTIVERTQAIWEELMARPLTCGGGGGAAGDATDALTEWCREEERLPSEFKRFVELRKLPLGFSSAIQRDTVLSPVGHGCSLLKEDLAMYMDYEVGKECPDDEAVTQKLLVGGCEPLPRRRCFARIPKYESEPDPVPDAFWTAPGDDKVIWTAHTCKGFECLRNRVKEKVFADCLDCFDLQAREKTRWVKGGGALDFSVEEVLRLKNGTIRIGLDLGGGPGTFAVRMKEHDVTILTTTLNLNGPFNNFVALRGVIPLYMTVSQRLPFFDNTLDLVHSMHVLSNWIPSEMLEFLLYDIDRVLRPGGVFWLDHFFCVRPQLDTYRPLIEQLGYKKLKWHIGDKLDRGPELQEVYISAVLEKPLRRLSTN